MTSNRCRLAGREDRASAGFHAPAAAPATPLISIGGSRVSVTAPEVDQLIADLAGARSGMQPPVPLQFDPARPMHNHETSELQPGIEPYSGDLALVFRSPGFGWLGFQIQRQAARMIRERYLATLGSVAPGTGKRQ